MMKYRLKPVGIKCNSYRTTFKHEQTGMLAGYEINYPYESYIVALVEGVTIAEVEALGSINLSTSLLIEEYDIDEEATDIRSIECFLEKLPEEVQAKIEEEVDTDELSWDEFFEDSDDFSYEGEEVLIDCAVKLEPVDWNLLTIYS